MKNQEKQFAKFVNSVFTEKIKSRCILGGVFIVLYMLISKALERFKPTWISEKVTMLFQEDIPVVLISALDLGIRISILGLLVLSIAFLLQLKEPFVRKATLMGDVQFGYVINAKLSREKAAHR